MPVGKDLVELVAKALDTAEPRSAGDVWDRLLSPRPSVRAVRYAINELIAQGRAKREPKPIGDLTKGRALLVKPEVEYPPQSASQIADVLVATGMG